MDRRTFLSATTMAATLPLAGAPVFATEQASMPRDSARMERLGAAIAASRMPVNFVDGRFSGGGYDWLVERGSQAHALLIGEEHGIAENPKLAAQLFTALVPRGYRHVAIEVSPPMAAAIDAALATRSPSDLHRFLTTPETRVAFFGMREEADWLQQARSALPGSKPFLWGLDYEIGADRHLIRLLKARPKSPAAGAALQRLEAASTASWTRYDQTKDPKYIYSFAGDPKLVRELRTAWRAADAHSRLVMETLEQTFAINALWVAGKGYESNAARSQFLRANLLRYWKSKERSDPDGRLLMKMGASHLVRGVNMSDVFDLGTIVPELLATKDRTSFHMMVLPGPGVQTANLDPTTFRYVPGNRDQYGKGMELFDRAVIPGTFTMFDTAPLRPIASSYSGEIPLPIWRVIHGFDAVLVMTGSTPSSNL